MNIIIKKQYSERSKDNLILYRRYYARVYLYLTGVFLLGLMIAMQDILQKGFGSFDILGAIGVGLMFYAIYTLIITLNGKAKTQKKRQRLINLHTRYGEMTEIHISDNGISMITPIFTTTISWVYLSHFTPEPDAIFLYVSDSSVSAIIIKHQDISEPEKNELLSFLKNNVPRITRSLRT